MTKPQIYLYRAEWSKARKAGGLKESDRHKIHVDVLGCDKSSLDLTNDEFDKVLAAFRAISAPTSLNLQLSTLNQPRQRLLHRIRDQLKCLQLFVDHPAQYLAAILRDRFKASQIEDLRTSEIRDQKSEIPWDDLTHLRNTLARCLSSFRRKAELSEHDMCQRAGVECFRPACAECRDAHPNLNPNPNLPPVPELQTADPF